MENLALMLPSRSRLRFDIVNSYVMQVSGCWVGALCAWLLLDLAFRPQFGPGDLLVAMCAGFSLWLNASGFIAAARWRAAARNLLRMMDDQ